jgi:hypothetical protein
MGTDPNLEGRRRGNGEFGNAEHADGNRPNLLGPGEVACSDCGTPTKRTSGLCRKCDPARKKGGAAAATPTRAQKQPKKSAIVDDSKPSLTPDQVKQCEYGNVPVVRRGAIVEGQVHRCKLATTGEFCHRHGGTSGESLGRTYAKAMAEAERGQCFPLKDEHWEQTEERIELAAADLVNMLDTDFSESMKAILAFAHAKRTSGSGRFSYNNQMYMVVQYVHRERRKGTDESEAWDRAIEAFSEPHHTKKDWEKLGRTVNDDALGVGVVWTTSARIKEEEDPNDPTADPVQTFIGSKVGYLNQFPLSETEGEPFDLPEYPEFANTPEGHGDPEAAIDSFVDLAHDLGVEVEFSDKPVYVGAKKVDGYMDAGAKKIVVDSTVAGGRAYSALTLAHELSHFWLEHGTDGQKETTVKDQELAAESAAHLMCLHHGIDTSDMSSRYLSGHSRGYRETGLGPFRSALKLFDDYLTAID